ncbi:hypothetical protein [Halomontanus rarus]|uniref:hypothetical protein n=1 Tax=Halomontanus rarus TaxID=3034020 RepID=UPI0023E8D0CB|nr:hypothetical protein [Halovivax sp. TS33]
MNISAGDVIVLAMVVVWVSVAATGGSAATSTAERGPIDHVGADIDDSVPPLASQDGPEQPADSSDRNASDRHRNPGEYSERGDLEGLESRLTTWLVDRLRTGAVELRDGEHAVAHGRVDERYDERVEQYVDIARETDGEHAGDAFEAAGTEQARLTAAVREYETTTADYDAALENGDRALAHDLARELDSLTGEIENASQLVDHHYTEIEDGTGADLSAADTAIETVVEDVRSEQREIRESQFVDTELTIASETDTSPISFRDPLETTGRLRTVDGEPIANETLRFDVGPTNQTVYAETAADGSFELAYRPTTTPLSTTELGVRYVPDHGSPYLETETTLDVTVSSVEPTVTVLERPDTVAYGDEVTISGTLAVGDVPVDEVPLVVTLDGRQLDTVRVSNGSFEGSMVIPASIADGERELGVSLPFDDRSRALAATAASEPTTVLETESELAMRATRTANDTVLVEGWLGTADREGVAEQPVEIRLENATVATVTTGGDGTFQTSVAVPRLEDGSERIETARGELRIRAIYDGTDANLEPARAETVATATSSAAGGERGPLSQPIPFWAWIGAGLVATATVVIGVRRYRRPDGVAGSPSFGRDSSSFGASQKGVVVESSPSSTSSDSTSTTAPISPSPARIRTRLEEATDHLTNGNPDTAVEYCYEAVRWDLEARIGFESGQTHWEFYRRYRDSSASGLEDLNTLRAITEGYERAVFDRQGNTTSDAERILEQAADLCRLEIEGTERAPLAAE